MLILTPIGGRSLIQAARTLATGHPVTVNMTRVYGPSETLAEAVQQLAHFQGRFMPPEALVPYVAPDLRHLRNVVERPRSDFYLIGALALDVFEYEGVALNPRLVHEAVAVACGAETADALLAGLLAGIGPDPAILACLPSDLARLLSGMRHRLLTPEAAISALREALPEPDAALGLLAEARDVTETSLPGLTHLSVPALEPSTAPLALRAAAVLGLSKEPAAEDVPRDAFGILARIPALAPYRDRILLDFPAMNRRFIMTEMRGDAAHPFSTFLLDVSDRIDAAAYRALQDRYLSAEALCAILVSDRLSPEEKYLDFPFWARSKFALARSLGLAQGPGKSVLDIGSGPGHFGVVCEGHGHRYLGLESGGQEGSAFNPNLPLFEDCFRVFGLSRVIHTVLPERPLALEGRFDLITCLMGNFNAIIDRHGNFVRPWNEREWGFLLRNLVRDHARPETTLFFQMSRNLNTPAVLRFVRHFALSFNEKANTFSFSGSLDLAAVERWRDTDSDPESG